ncbi:AraC family transcriptional regulator [Wenyingzhuangia sp. 2_MG-2023]|uniref:helix-turn-helix domain-containing protein n=1 Tax=Wenyingzhuangia sp. 2_MG-2023 TaxID=3062639 RepID=UPI0026E1402A|nr:AraC family transcriptional regulator [Wenyingzhuangia sp. 2_MG-2023]MDO6739248.1 AraC family transcriptional regulator [Wenyingzhuangia sp. 2_MG-2023]
MSEILHIKNMVCDRCKTIVQQILEENGYEIKQVELGEVRIEGNEFRDYKQLEQALKKNGFELIKGELDSLIEQIKTKIIQKIEENDTEGISVFLSTELGKTFSALSKIFSKSEGITIEKYIINLKVEKVKELIQLGQLNFSEIAYSLNYKTSSHLAKQFKNTTGISMTQFKDLRKWDRKSRDQIV